MIRIELTEKRECYELSITGHSGYKEIGSDIVCSAVSVLRTTLDNYLDGGGVLQSGECFLVVDKKDADAVVILRAIRVSMKQIANTYYKYVMFAYKGDKDGKDFNDFTGSNYKSGRVEAKCIH